MNSPTLAAGSLFLVACLASAPAFAQDKPPAPAAAKQPAAGLAASSQGKEKAPVDITVSLRHAPSADAKCANAACETADHWVAELEVAGRKAEDKPVAIVMTQRKVIEKELRDAAAPKARRAGAATISDATLSIRVPVQAPYGFVHQLIATAASAGIHRIEFAVVSAGAAAVEQSLPVPLPADTGAAKIVEADTKDAPQEIRIAVLMDQAKGEPVRQFGKHALPTGAEGDTQLRALVQAAAKDFAKLGVENAPGVIDAGNGVPWQAVVGVIDALRSAGVKDVQFAVAAAKK